MSSQDADADPLGNDTDTTTRQSRPTYRAAPSTKFPPFFVPRRPQVVKMRDLSPATKARLTSEYYDVYDPWTGIRIAATLGILISLFTLFLIYKSKFNKSKNTVQIPKKTSLYLYDEEDEDQGNVGSSDDSSSYGYSFAYNGEDRIPQGYHFGLRANEFPLEEVLVKSSVVECVALTVHPKNPRNSRGPKYGTLRITEEVSRSLPCSPYKQSASGSGTAATATAAAATAAATVVKEQGSPDHSTRPSSLSGSITSFGSSDVSDCNRKSTFANMRAKAKGIRIISRSSSGRRSQKTATPGEDITGDDNSGIVVPASTVVVSAKRPLDYRSRSTVVAIARRKRKI